MPSDEIPTARSADNNRPRLKVDWTINPTHIGAFLAVIAACFTFVYGLREDINKTNTVMEKLVSELKNKNELQDIEIKSIKDANVISRAEEIQSRGEIRTSVTEIVKILTDERIANAERRAMDNNRTGPRR